MRARTKRWLILQTVRLFVFRAKHNFDERVSVILRQNYEKQAGRRLARTLAA